MSRDDVTEDDFKKEERLSILGARSRRKGNSFENEVAKRLRKEFGLQYEDLYRTPLSGGHVTPGDLVKSRKFASVFPFHIECKKREGWALDAVLLTDYSQRGWAKKGIWGWVAQAVRDAPKHEVPILILGKNRQKPLVVVCFNDNAVIHTSIHGFYRVKHELTSSGCFVYVAPAGRTWTYLLVSLDDFIRSVKAVLSASVRGGK